MNQCIIHQSEGSNGPELEIMEVFANDPDDERTETLCIIEGHDSESWAKANRILTALNNQ